MFNRKEYQKQYRQEHKKHKKEYDNKYSQTHKAKIKQYRQEHKEQTREQLRKYHMTIDYKFSYYQTNAKIKGFTFNITLNEFSKLLSQPCHYCGGESYGLDRIDSSIGYLKDNIVPCCSMCNYMKRIYTEDEFIEQCVKIVDYTTFLKEMV